MPFVAPAIPLGQMDARQQATFFAQAGIQAGQTTKQFTPTFTGFASAPTGGPMYYMNFGSIVFMWTEVGFAGNSSANTFTITNIPAEITPRGIRAAKVTAYDNGLIERDAVIYVSEAGTAGLALGDVDGAGGPVSYLLAGWDPAAVKGLPPGFLAVYIK